MAGQKTPFKCKYLLLNVEGVEGQGAALPATSVLRTENLSVNIGINGDTTTPDYDGCGADALNNPDETTGRQNGCNFNTPFAFPDTLGTAGPLDGLLRICGFNPTYNAAAKTTSYARAELDAIDSGHWAMRADKSGAKEVEYQAKGSRGTFDLSFEVGKRMMLSNIELLGAYLRPDQVANLTPDQQSALTNLGAALTVASIDTISMDGTPICLQSLEVKNVGALAFNKAQDSCEDAATMAENVNPTGTVTYRKPDFDTEFNPFALADTNSTTAIPLQIVIVSDAVGKFTLNLEIQPQMPSRTELKGKNTGFDQPFKCLALPTFETAEAA